MKKTKTLLMITLFILLQILLGCEDKSTKPKEYESLSEWTKVSAFGDQPIYGLYVNHDSTRINVVSDSQQGFLLVGDHFNTFTTIDLSDQIPIIPGLHKYTLSLPYIDENKMFFCNNDLTKMYVYQREDSFYIKQHELQVNEFISDEFDNTFFARSTWVNRPNHIIEINDGMYGITIESHKISPVLQKEPKNIYANCYVVGVSFNENVSDYEINFKNRIGQALSGDSKVMSTHIINSKMIQFCHLLGSQNPVITDANGITETYNSAFLVRDIINNNGIYYGLGDGVIYKSTDLINWSKQVNINGPWSITSIAGKDVLFYGGCYCIMNWDEISLTQLELLDIGNNTLRTSFIVQFKDLVYVGTNYGLYVRSVESFFSSRSDKKIQIMEE